MIIKYTGEVVKLLRPGSKWTSFIRAYHRPNVAIKLILSLWLNVCKDPVFAMLNCVLWALGNNENFAIALKQCNKDGQKMGNTGSSVNLSMKSWLALLQIISKIGFSISFSTFHLEEQYIICGSWEHEFI